MKTAGYSKHFKIDLEGKGDWTTTICFNTGNRDSRKRAVATTSGGADHTETNVCSRHIWTGQLERY